MNRTVVSVNRPSTWMEKLWALEAGFRTDTDRTEETPELDPVVVPVTVPAPELVPA